MTTKKDIINLITVLKAGFPKQVITEEQFDQMIPVWHSILEDIPVELLVAAASDYCAQDNPFFPSVGQIRQRALDMTATDADRLTAGDAWDEVCRAFRSHGRNRLPEWSHPDIERTVKAMGGWIYLCTSENPISDRARFMDTFGAYRKRAETDRRMLPSTREIVSRYRQLEYNDRRRLVESQIKRLTDRFSR